jgi:hypothetical protein
VAVRDLCTGLDRLIKSQRSAHNLVGERGGSAVSLPIFWALVHDFTMADFPRGLDR